MDQGRLVTSGGRVRTGCCVVQSDERARIYGVLGDKRIVCQEARR